MQREKFLSALANWAQKCTMRHVSCNFRDKIPVQKKFPKNFYLRRASGREISQISLMRRIFLHFSGKWEKKILSALGRNLGKYFYLRRGFCCLERLGKNSKISICTQKKNISICESATVSKYPNKVWGS